MGKFKIRWKILTWKPPEMFMTTEVDQKGMKLWYVSFNFSPFVDLLHEYIGSRQFTFKKKICEHAFNDAYTAPNPAEPILMDRSSSDREGLCSQRYLTLRVKLNFGADW